MHPGITYLESDLVPLLKHRQEHAFSYLYDHYSGALYSVILSIVPDRELANDVLQEAFVKIWRQIESYDNTKGRLFTWMLNVTRNTSIDAVRSKNYKQGLQNKELTENVHDAAGSIEINSDKIGLRKIVQKLKEDHRILVELSYFEGYTQDEISKMLNMPLGTVKTRLRSALVQLKQAIKP